MIDARGRDPLQTVQEVQTLFAQAKARRLQPMEFELGFFQARDLMLMRHPQARAYGKGRPITMIHGYRCRVTQLEDKMTLVCAAIDVAGEYVRLEIDRGGC